MRGVLRTAGLAVRRGQHHGGWRCPRAGFLLPQADFSDRRRDGEDESAFGRPRGRGSGAFGAFLRRHEEADDSRGPPRQRGHDDADDDRYADYDDEDEEEPLSPEEQERKMMRELTEMTGDFDDPELDLREGDEGYDGPAGVTDDVTDETEDEMYADAEEMYADEEEEAEDGALEEGEEYLVGSVHDDHPAEEDSDEEQEEAVEEEIGPLQGAERDDDGDPALREAAMEADLDLEEREQLMEYIQWMDENQPRGMVHGLTVPYYRNTTERPRPPPRELSAALNDLRLPADVPYRADRAEDLRVLQQMWLSATHNHHMSQAQRLELITTAANMLASRKDVDVAAAAARARQRAGGQRRRRRRGGDGHDSDSDSDLDSDDEEEGLGLGTERPPPVKRR